MIRFAKEQQPTKSNYKIKEITIELHAIV